MIPQFNTGDEVVRRENPRCPPSHDHVVFVRTGIVRPLSRWNAHEWGDFEAAIARCVECSPNFHTRICSISSKSGSFPGIGVASAFDDDQTILHERGGRNVSNIDTGVPLDIGKHRICDPFSVSSFTCLCGKGCKQKQGEDEDCSSHQSSL